MSDARRRELERLADQGDLPARAALLQARVRAGEITDEGLRLAAYLGAASARLALGDAAGPDGSARRAPELVLGLKPFGPDAFLRAARVACRRLHPRPEGVLAAIDTWLACAREDHARALRTAAREAELGHWDPRDVGPAAYVVRLASRPLQTTRRCCVASRDGEGRDHWSCGIRRRSRRFSPERSALLHARITDALLAWALGGRNGDLGESRAEL